MYGEIKEELCIHVDKKRVTREGTDENHTNVRRQKGTRREERAKRRAKKGSQEKSKYEQT